MATVANLTGNNQDDKDNVNSNTGSPTPNLASQESSPIQAGSPAPTPNQGSGHFTNVTKYLQANQNAGQQIGNKIQTGINRELNSQVSQANNQANAFKQGVQKAQGNIRQGTGYLGNVGGAIEAYNNYLTQAAPEQAPVVADKMDYDRMMGLANDQDQFQKFTGLRSGATQEADKAELDKSGTAHQASVDTANQRLNTRQDQLASENSRYGLLNEFIAPKNTISWTSPEEGRRRAEQAEASKNQTPEERDALRKKYTALVPPRTTYAAGNQRLDQLFLQRDNKNTLGALNQNLNTQRNTTFKGLSDTAKDLQTKSQAAQEQGLNLTKDLTGQTGKNTQQEIDDLQSQVGTINEQRSKEIARYRDFVEGLKQGKVTDAELFDKFGLQSGSQTFNVLNDKDLTADQIANLSAQQARDYRDIATQKDVDIYKSLAALAGKDTSALNAAGQLEAAAAAKTGEGSLQDRINKARQAFLDNAKNANITGTGSDTYGDWLRGRGTETRTATANLGQLLANAGYLPDAGGKSRGSPSATNIITGAVDPINTMIGSLTGLPNIGKVLDSIQSHIFGDGGKGGAAHAAQVRAQQDLEAQVNNYLKNAGFGNVLTRGGVVDTTKYTDQMRAFDNQKAQLLRDLNSEFGANLDLNATPEQIRAAAAAKTGTMTQMNPDEFIRSIDNRMATPTWMPRALTKDEINEGTARNESALNQRLSGVRDIEAQRNNQQALLNQLLGVNNPSDTSPRVGSQVEQDKSPIMSYAEAVAAARARGNT
jgi:hypothetical protein